MSLSWARTAVAVAIAMLATTTAAQAAPRSAHVYATSWSLNMRQYAADDAGLLSPLTPPTVDAGSNSTDAVASPDGKSLYVVNQVGNSISQYDVGAGGTLSPKTPGVVSTGTSPFGIAIAPDGRHAYVAYQGDDEVGVYDVGEGGELTLTSRARAGQGPVEVAVSPDGHSAYVTNFSDATVSEYDVSGDGSLRPKAPAAVPAGDAPVGLALSPDGGAAYVTNQLDDGIVSQFAVGSDGVLSPMTPRAVPTGALPAGVVVGAHGVYVADFGSDTISRYDADAEGGLHAVAEVAGPVNPFGLALAPAGDALYAAGFGDATIGQFAVAADGSLEPKDPASVAASFHPMALVVIAHAVDDAAPTIDLRSPADGATYRLGADVRADYSCADDGESGLSACDGDVADGEAIDTGSVGEHDFTVVARDGAGNEERITHRYRVVYPFEGFFGPVHDGDRVSAGVTLSIAFSLGGDRGLDVLAGGSPTSVRVDCDDPGEPVGGTPADSTRGLRFSPSSGLYGFDWKTRRFWAGTCRSFVLALDDGTVHRLLVEFKDGYWYDWWR
jgi:DNA-binding beta-propeller fold protein YncE